MAKREVTLLAAALLLGGIGAYFIFFSVHEPPVDTPNWASVLPRPAVGPPWFRDVAAESGLNFTYRNGEEAGEFTILESLGGGIGLIDYDGDGLLDVFAAGGGSFVKSSADGTAGLPCKLFRNRGSFRFEDVTAAAGFGGLNSWYSHGSAVADYDRDGWPDLAVTGYGRIAIFHNEAKPGGGRTFIETTAALGVTRPQWATSAAWGDIDGDGFPELYVCQYVDWSFANHPVCQSLAAGSPRDVCPPQRFKPLMHILYKNESGKKFRNVADEHRFTATGCGLGVVIADLNGDGRPDIYVANDASLNFLHLNRVDRLEECGSLAGVSVDDSGRYNGSMGVDAADFDGTGRPALFVTNFQSELSAHYRNLGEERFIHLSRSLGLGAYGQQYVGFGCAFLDADHDGWEDMIIANGHVLHRALFGSEYRQKPLFLRNVEARSGRVWQDLSAEAGEHFQTPALGRGLAVGDLDNDGWTDVVSIPTNSPVAILRNVMERKRTADWIGVRLLGKGHRDVVGSTVTLEVGPRRLTRFAKSGGSYLSSSDPRLLFGLHDAFSPVRITVKWAWGGTESWAKLEPGAYWELREGDPAAKKAR